MIVENFPHLTAYIEAQSQHDDLTAVPIPLVADHLQVTPAAVVAMLKTDRLDGVKIGSSTLVKLASLQRRQNDRSKEVEIVFQYLKKCAKDGKRVIFYEPVMAAVNMTPRVPAHRTRIGQILGEVSERTYKEKGVLLSVLVHQKTAGVTRPGKGFFKLAHDDIGLSWQDEDDFVREETDKVLEAYR
jgi:hypothetical protein